MDWGSDAYVQFGLLFRVPHEVCQARMVLEGSRVFLGTGINRLLVPVKGFRVCMLRNWHGTYRDAAVRPWRERSLLAVAVRDEAIELMKLEKFCWTDAASVEVEVTRPNNLIVALPHETDRPRLWRTKSVDLPGVEGGLGLGIMLRLRGLDATIVDRSTRTETVGEQNETRFPSVRGTPLSRRAGKLKVVQRSA